jgi:hypothetical protein
VSNDPVARRHRQLVWRLAQGRTSERVAAVTGCTADWVRTTARRYNEHGPAGLGDRSHRHLGGRSAVAVSPASGAGSGTGPASPRWRPVDRLQSGGLDDCHPGPAGLESP